MRIFVSGATGVIGRRVVPLLLAQGHSVTAVAHNTPSPSGMVRATFVPVDLFDLDALKRAVAGHDAIINLATHMPSATWKMLFRSAWRLNDRIRSEAVANLVEAALCTGIGTIVQESFALTYPDRGDNWIDEGTALIQLNTTGPLSTLSNRSNGFPVTAAPAWPYGLPLSTARMRCRLGATSMPCASAGRHCRGEPTDTSPRSLTMTPQPRLSRR